jgi:hypothetical protein
MKAGQTQARSAALDLAANPQSPLFYEFRRCISNGLTGNP